MPTLALFHINSRFSFGPQVQSSFCPSFLVFTNAFFLSQLFAHLLPLLRLVFYYIVCLCLISTFISVTITFEVEEKLLLVHALLMNFVLPGGRRAGGRGGGEKSANAAVDIDLCHNDGSIVDNNCFRLVSEKRLRFALIFCSLVNLIK